MLVPEDLRVTIRARLAEGRLPQDRLPDVWVGPGNGETCLACDGVITRSNVVMRGIGAGLRAVQFHVQCFHVWDSERDASGC